MNNKFKIGQRVVVVNDGKTYPTYEEMAKLMGLENWKKGNEFTNSTTAVIVNVKPHISWPNEILYGIQIDNGKQAIIHEDGLELVKQLPSQWYVKCTDNIDDTPELAEWRKEAMKSVSWNTKGSISETGWWRYSGYELGTEISYDDFLELVYKPWKNKNTNTMKPLDTTQTIKITKEQLYAYYEAATDSQKEYMDEHFKLSGTTTVQGIIGLHDIACTKWKPIIKKNHPECFPENKYFDLSGLKKDKSEGNYIFTHEQGKKAGFGSYHFLQVRGCGEYENKGFYLHPDYNWGIVNDSNGVLVLLPTKK
jgi:hypothetical protein